jgi:hypothetical protein
LRCTSPFILILVDILGLVRWFVVHFPVTTLLRTVASGKTVEVATERLFRSRVPARVRRDGVNGLFHYYRTLYLLESNLE